MMMMMMMMNFVHKFNNLKSSYHFLKNFLARCALSIAFYPPLRNKSMQNVLYQLHLYIYIYILFFLSLSLTDSFQNSLKTSINCTKLRIQCPKIVCVGRGGGLQKKMREDVRMGE